MVSYKSVTIDGTAYMIQQFTAGKSLRLMTRLSKILGPSLGSFVSSGGLKKEKVEDLFGQAVAGIFDRLDEDSVCLTVQMILEGTTVNNIPVSEDWETRFMGKLPSLFRVLKESLKVQYGDFSNVLALFSQKAQAMRTAAESSAQSISSGPSGE